MRYYVGIKPASTIIFRSHMEPDQRIRGLDFWIGSYTSRRGAESAARNIPKTNESGQEGMRFPIKTYPQDFHKDAAP